MNGSTEAGYQEIEHTADWQIEVWAQNLPELFAQAAKGMYSLAQIELESGREVSWEVNLQEIDLESLLVAFLTELVILAEEERLGFNQFSIELHGVELHADLRGGAIANQSKEIKAVTFHNLNIEQENQHYRASIVFDV